LQNFNLEFAFDNELSQVKLSILSLRLDPKRT